VISEQIQRYATPCRIEGDIPIDTDVVFRPHRGVHGVGGRAQSGVPWVEDKRASDIARLGGPANRTGHPRIASGAELSAAPIAGNRTTGDVDNLALQRMGIAL